MKKGKSKTGLSHDDGSSDEDLDNYSSHEDAETEDSDYSDFSFIDTETVDASPNISSDKHLTPKKTPATKAPPKRSPAVRKPATTNKIKTPKSGKHGSEKEKTLPKPSESDKSPKPEDSQEPTVRVLTVRELRDKTGLPVYKRPGGTFTISSDDLNTDKKVPLMAPNLKRIPTSLSNCVHGKMDPKRKSKSSKNSKMTQWARLCIPIGGDEDDINADPLKPKQELQMVLDAVFEASRLADGFVVQKRKKMVTTSKAAKKLYQICKMNRNSQWEELKALNIPYKCKDDCPFNVAGNTANLFLLSDGALAELKSQIGDESAEPNTDKQPIAVPAATVTEEEEPPAPDTLDDDAGTGTDSKGARKRSRASIVQGTQPESESPNKKQRVYNVQVTISSEMTEEEALQIVRKMNATN